MKMFNEEIKKSIGYFFCAIDRNLFDKNSIGAFQFEFNSRE